MSKRRLNVEDPDFLDYMAATPPAAEISSDESDDDGFVNEVFDEDAGGSDNDDFGGVLEMAADDDEIGQANQSTGPDQDQDQEESANAWRLGDIDPKFPDFTPKRTPGPLVSLLKKDPRPIDYFKLFIPPRMIQHITTETNRYAKAFLDRATLRPKSRFRKWYDVTENEMWAFFGVIIAMSLVKVANIQDYWSNDPVLQTPFVKSIMKRDRFLLLMTFLHVNDNSLMLPRDHPDFDPLFKIRPFVDCLQERFESLYQPFENIAFDEATIPWTAPLGFRVYNKDKPHKYGLRVYQENDSKNGYTMRFEVYTGKKKASANGATYDVVMRLMEPYLDQGYKLYTDNFYTSPVLYMALRKRKTGACGTLRLNRIGLHESMKKKKVVKDKGDSRIMNNSTMNHIKFMDRKEVNILTTIHSAEIVNTGKLDYKKEPIYKYASVHDYNRKMNAVDRSDQLMHYAEFRRRTVKWWKRALFHLFILAEINTYQFYKETELQNRHRPAEEVQSRKRPMSHSRFRRELCKDLTSLTPTPALSPRQRNACVGDTDVLRLTARQFPSPLATKVKNGNKFTLRRQCFVCKSIDQRKDVGYECTSCNKALCVSPCFEIYHTYADYKRARARSHV